MPIWFTCGRAYEGWLLATLVVGMGGCARTVEQETPVPSARKTNSVPAQPPDTVPSWVNADSSMANRSGYIAVRFTKTVVALQFRPEAIPPQRQAAVESVAGTVIGGYRAAGIYLVQVSDPGDGSGIIRAVERLEALPYVLGATPNVEVAPWSVRRREPVPVVAPDSVPAWVRADSNMANASSHIPVRFRKNILVVHFRRTATQAERQAAIDLVSGTVVGGHSGGTGNGMYLVRVLDPGDGSRLAEASEQLQALSQVTAAGPDVELGPNK